MPKHIRESRRTVLNSAGKWSDLLGRDRIGRYDYVGRVDIEFLQYQYYVGCLECNWYRATEKRSVKQLDEKRCQAVNAGLQDVRRD